MNVAAWGMAAILLTCAGGVVYAVTNTQTGRLRGGAQVVEAGAGLLAFLLSLGAGQLLVGTSLRTEFIPLILGVHPIVPYLAVCLVIAVTVVGFLALSPKAVSAVPFGQWLLLAAVLMPSLIRSLPDFPIVDTLTGLWSWAGDGAGWVRDRVASK